MKYFRYVRHEAVPDYEAEGWRVAADLGPVHGHWSVLMEWAGDGRLDQPRQGQPGEQSAEAGRNGGGR